MGNPLEWITRGCRGRRGAFGGGAARWWADFAGERRSDASRDYGLQRLAPTGPGKAAGAHRGLKSTEETLQGDGV